MGLAERELVGAALDDARITDSLPVTAGHFDDPMLGAIWEAVRAIHGDGGRATPSLILDVTGKAGARIDPLVLPELVGAGMVVNAERYAEQILDGHRRRSIEDALSLARQRLAEGLPTDEVVAGITQGLDVATEAEEDAEGLLTLDEFVDQQVPDEEWVIPGLFAVGERAVVTGDEGAGKSMLMRQFAVCAAAGVNPFTYQRFAPKRVLVVDAENPKRIMVDKFKGIRDSLGQMTVPALTEDRMWIRRYPQGLDLSQARDRLTLHNLCMLTRPELLVIGPAYKLYVGGNNQREEDLARQVTSVLDGLREEFGSALLLEHHSPHENNQTGKRFPRPIGSSLWRRWPEYGFGLQLEDSGRDAYGRPQRTVSIKHWRGMREDRPWPTSLISGGRLPWAAENPNELTGAA